MISQIMKVAKYLAVRLVFACITCNTSLSFNVSNESSLHYTTPTLSEYFNLLLTYLSYIVIPERPNKQCHLISMVITKLFSFKTHIQDFLPTKFFPARITYRRSNHTQTTRVKRIKETLQTIIVRGSFPYIKFKKKLKQRLCSRDLLIFCTSESLNRNPLVIITVQLRAVLIVSCKHIDPLLDSVSELKI